MYPYTQMTVPSSMLNVNKAHVIINILHGTETFLTRINLCLIHKGRIKWLHCYAFHSIVCFHPTPRPHERPHKCQTEWLMIVAVVEFWVSCSVTFVVEGSRLVDQGRGQRVGRIIFITAVLFYHCR